MDVGVLQKSSKHLFSSPTPRSSLCASNMGFALVYDTSPPLFHKILDPPLNMYILQVASIPGPEFTDSLDNSHKAIKQR